MSSHVEESASGGAGSATGLAAESLRRAIHDLRGPLNTLSILHEVLRTAGAATALGCKDALATASRSVRALSTMLDRLGTVADTMVITKVAVAMADGLAAAVARSQPGATVTWMPPVVEPADLAALSCPARLGLALDTLLHCAIAAMPQGGVLRFVARGDGAQCRIELHCDVGEVAVPPAGVRGKLDANDPGLADWFRLVCQVEGLAGRLVIDPAGCSRRLELCLPRA